MKRIAALLSILVLPFACSDDPEGSNSDCGGDPGSEGCPCIAGSECLGTTLSCASNVCVDIGDTPTTGTSTTGASTTGSPPTEDALCEKTDECNLLMPGTSVQDCSDLVAMCTDDLLSSQYADWQNEVATCLDLSNCQNFLGCVGELSACPSVTPGDECTEECVYCFFDTELENMCDDSWNGDGACDCGCQFTDVDC